MAWLVQLSVQNICFHNFRFNLSPILSENAPNCPLIKCPLFFHFCPLLKSGHYAVVLRVLIKIGFQQKCGETNEVKCWFCSEYYMFVNSHKKVTHIQHHLSTFCVQARKKDPKVNFLDIFPLGFMVMPWSKLLAKKSGHGVKKSSL